MIKYIGSKRALVPTIVSIVRSLPEVRTVADPFSGTARVGAALKAAGYQVYANDLLTYAHVLATTYVQADRADVAAPAAALIAELDALPGRPGYFTETFCERSRFFQPKNGARIDAIRDAIDTLDVGPELRAVLLTSLMTAADRVDSTTGVHMAYLKKWSPRASNDLLLRVPDLVPAAAHGPCRATQGEALDALEAIAATTATASTAATTTTTATTTIQAGRTAPAFPPADLTYLDPPYNQHAYLGNYHIWETLVRWDRPETYGVACKRVDCQERKSAFNSRRRCHAALAEVIDAVTSPFLVVSFNDEGFVSRAELEAMLRSRGDVHVVERSHARYVGARIGIHNHRGEAVGSVGRLRNTEFLFVVVPAGYAWKWPVDGATDGPADGTTGDVAGDTAGDTAGEVAGRATSRATSGQHHQRPEAPANA